MKRIDILLLQLCFLPSYVWYMKRMQMGGEEALSALLVPVCLIIAYLYRKENTNVHTNKDNNIALCGVVVYILCWLIGVPAMIKASVAITVLLFYFKLLPHFGISALAYLSLPWLSSFQYFFGFPLRRFVAEAGALLLNVFGLSVEAQGTGLSFNGAEVFVDPPCSGVRMILAILVLTALAAVVFQCSWKKGIWFGVLALLMAVLGNVVRAVILFFPESYLVEWPGWTHEGVGLLVYTIVCLVLIWLFNLINHDKKIIRTVHR